MTDYEIEELAYVFSQHKLISSKLIIDSDRFGGILRPSLNRLI
jgi:hypothetical protein